MEISLPTAKPKSTFLPAIMTQPILPPSKIYFFAFMERQNLLCHLSPVRSLQSPICWTQEWKPGSRSFFRGVTQSPISKRGSDPLTLQHQAAIKFSLCNRPHVSFPKDWSMRNFLPSLGNVLGSWLNFLLVNEEIKETRGDFKSTCSPFFLAGPRRRKNNLIILYFILLREKLVVSQESYIFWKKSSYSNSSDSSN